jgi:hypothetical protein
MRKAAIILFSALALGAGLFAVAFLCARHLCVQQMAQSTDDLDWLRLEFRLKDTELARIRAMHEGYLPKCHENCQRIAAKKEALAQAIAAGTNATATIDQLRADVRALREHCQQEMLAHFEEVSRAMPPEQGERYLAEMRRLVLGAHEQVEASMSATNAHAHEHH